MEESMDNILESKSMNPPISYGTMKKEKEGSHKKNVKYSLQDYTERILTPIFAKTLGVPKEDILNSITTPDNSFKIFFRPNNWRLQIEVKEKTNSTIDYLRKTFPTIKFNEHNKLLTLNEGNIVIQYGKKTLTTIYSCPVIRGVKQGWMIERDTILLITNRIDEIKEKIEKTLYDTLKEFSRKFRVFLPFKRPIWGRHEDFIKGESYIDKIPRECQFIDTVVKKVYAEPGVEFIGGKGEEPTLKVKTYLKNQSIKDHSPEIAESIDNLGNHLIPTIRSLDKSIKMEIENKKIHLGVLKNMNKTLKDIRESLPKRGLLKWL